MRKELLSNNITLAGLRRLRDAYRKTLGDKFAVFVTLETVQYQKEAGSDIREELQIWYSNAEKHLKFKSLKEAYDYLKTMKKGE